MVSHPEFHSEAVHDRTELYTLIREVLEESSPQWLPSLDWGTAARILVQRLGPTPVDTVPVDDDDSTQVELVPAWRLRGLE